ncbi:hypothetical protein HMPREF0574_1346 [Mobiluncus curtisii subsp. curtisii ATCC 35241]|nr:hypothetical protein HMPREF0574_1346 [Mobiluncus curtisii subsp. curtisii ATCC 35241]
MVFLVNHFPHTYIRVGEHPFSPLIFKFSPRFQGFDAKSLS